MLNMEVIWKWSEKDYSLCCGVHTTDWSCFKCTFLWHKDSQHLSCTCWKLFDVLSEKYVLVNQNNWTQNVWVFIIFHVKRRCYIMLHHVTSWTQSLHEESVSRDQWIWKGAWIAAEEVHSWLFVFTTDSTSLDPSAAGTSPSFSLHHFLWASCMPTLVRHSFYVWEQIFSDFHSDQ